MQDIGHNAEGLPDAAALIPGPLVQRQARTLATTWQDLLVGCSSAAPRLECLVQCRAPSLNILI